MICNLLCKEIENYDIAARYNKNYRNKMGKIVQISEALGLPVNRMLKHPDFLLCINETGFNLNSQEDCKVGSEKFIGSVLDKKFIIICNETDCFMTILGFTNSIGGFAMCYYYQNYLARIL